MKDGKVNVKVRWKEVGDVLKEQKIDGFMQIEHDVGFISVFQVSLEVVL